MDLTEDEVRMILRLVDELDYGEIHLTIGPLRIDLVKTRPGEASSAPVAPIAKASTPQPASSMQLPPHAAFEPDRTS